MTHHNHAFMLDTAGPSLQMTEQTTSSLPGKAPIADGLELPSRQGGGGAAGGDAGWMHHGRGGLEEYPEEGGGKCEY